MLTIERDTTSRGTPERPQYLIFLRYGGRPAQEMWLDATTGAEALAEAARRLPGETFTLKCEVDNERE